MDLLAGLKALADSKRLKILAMLAENELCVEALARHLDLSEPAVSQHVKKLREAGFVVGEKRGYYVHYSARDEVVDEFAGALKNLTEHVVFPEECVEDHGDQCCREEADCCC